jgi:Trehalose-6-phosphate synthase
MNTFRLQLRFLIPLLLTLGLAAYLALPLMDSLTLRWFSRDLNSRGELVTNALSDSIAEALNDPAHHRRLLPLFARAAKDERLIAIGLCSRNGILLEHTENYPASLTCDAAKLAATPASPIIQIPGGAAHIGVHEVVDETGPIASLVLLHDLSFIARRSEDTRRYLVILIAALGATIALITAVVAQLSWRGWVSGAQALLRGEGLIRPIAAPGELAPFAADLRLRLRDLDDEYRRSLDLETSWTSERLRGLLRTQLRGDEVIVVSNREPYIHDRESDGSITLRRPASGLVTASSR